MCTLPSSHCHHPAIRCGHLFTNLQKRTLCSLPILALLLPCSLFVPAKVSSWKCKRVYMVCLLRPRSSLPLEQRVKNVILKHTYRSLCQSWCMAEDTPDAPKASYLGISSNTVFSTSALIYWIWHWKDWTSGPSDKMILIRVSKALTCNKPWVKCYELMTQISTTFINKFNICLVSHEEPRWSHVIGLLSIVHSHWDWEELQVRFLEYEPFLWGWTSLTSRISVDLSIRCHW